MEVRTLDPVSAKLAMQLQLDDVCDVLRESKVGSDEYAAFQAMQVSFQDIVQVLEGQCHALSMLRREHDARLEFERLVQEERQAVSDHNEALRLGGLESTAPGTSPCDFGNPLDTSMGAEEESASILQSACVDTGEVIDPLPDYHSIFGSDNNSHRDSPWGNGRVSSAPFIPRAGPSKGKGKAGADAISDQSSHGICSACMEQHARFDLLELTCKRKDETASHSYCRTCLNDLFESSLTDTTLFPPRCCRVPIRLSACMHLLPAKLIQRCEEKEAELATVNPVYCSNISCGRFIPPRNVTADVATCLECNSKTCGICKNPNHNGVCPRDPTVQMLMDVASEKKWTRCYQCRTMVELIHGCYHMRCRCGAQFCYLCAKPWKTCDCDQWHENRLLSNAPPADDRLRQIEMPEEEEMLEANPVDDVFNDINMRLAAVAHGFATNDQDESSHGEDGDGAGRCVHDWHRVYSQRSRLDTCGVCGWYLKFLNYCGACETKVCNRCLHNRM